MGSPVLTRTKTIKPTDGSTLTLVSFTGIDGIRYTEWFVRATDLDRLAQDYAAQRVQHNLSTIADLQRRLDFAQRALAESEVDHREQLSALRRELNQAQCASSSRFGNVVRNIHTAMYHAKDLLVAAELGSHVLSQKQTVGFLTRALDKALKHIKEAA